MQQQVLETRLCEALERLADPHTGPVEGPSQGDEDQEQQHRPRGVDPLVGLGLLPGSSLQRHGGHSGDIGSRFRWLKQAGSGTEGF